MIIQLIVLVILLQAIGFLWYGPLFGKKWAAVIGVPMMSEDCTPEEKKAMQRKMMPTYILGLITTIVMTFAVFIFAHLFYLLPVMILLYVGIILPLYASAALWSGKPKKLAWQMFWLTAGYQLAAFVVMTLVFMFW